MHCTSLFRGLHRMCWSVYMNGTNYDMCGHRQEWFSITGYSYFLFVTNKKWINNSDKVCSITDRHLTINKRLVNTVCNKDVSQTSFPLDNCILSNCIDIFHRCIDSFFVWRQQCWCNAVRLVEVIIMFFTILRMHTVFAFTEMRVYRWKSDSIRILSLVCSMNYSVIFINLTLELGRSYVNVWLIIITNQAPEQSATIPSSTIIGIEHNIFKIDHFVFMNKYIHIHISIDQNSNIISISKRLFGKYRKLDLYQAVIFLSTTRLPRN